MAQTEKNKTAPATATGGFNRKTVAIIICAVFAVCVLGTLFGISYTALSKENIYDGVKVCGVDVSKMTVAEAEMLVRDTYGASFDDKTVKLVHNGNTKEINLSGMVRLDALKTAENAYNFGREGNVFKRIFAVVFTKDKDIPLVLEINEDFVKSEVFAFASEIESGHSVFEIFDESGEVSIDLSAYKGAITDVSETSLKISENLSRLDFSDVELVLCEDFDSDFSETLYNRINRQPVNASYRVTESGLELVEHVNGVTVDKAEIARHIEDGEETFTVSAVITEPEITTTKLKANAFADVLGAETTKFNSAEVNRTANVRLAANLINGTVIPSGQEFSFNRVVGERTYARGFRNAGVYTNGELVDGIGGGICQVASTLYTAQLYADLKTVSRRNHMFTVAYSPLGQDATVAWGSVDYVFANSTPYPIKIECYTDANTVTVRILGTKDDPSKSIKIFNQTVGSKAFEEKEEMTDELPAGETKIKQNGHYGYTVDTYKIYLVDGVEVNREYIHRSVYSPMTKIVLVSSLEPEEVIEGEATEGETPDTEKEPEGEALDVETVPGDETETEMESETSETEQTPLTPETETTPETPATEEQPELSDTGL